MKIEHQLSPAMQGVVKHKLAELNELRQRYLLALGQAKEIELAADQKQAALSDQLGMIQAAEGLPAPIGVYRLNEAGTHLVGEIADPPAAAPVAIEPAAAPVGEPQKVNGVEHHAG
jgi:hypothetical protein